MMKIIPLVGLLLLSFSAQSQKIDSIYFHLYTDSLKKGTYNYINVDAKLSNGRWSPVSIRDIVLSTTGGEFDGNDLFIPADFKAEYVIVKAALKNNAATVIERKIWIKKKPDEALPTKEQVINEINKKRR